MTKRQKRTFVGGEVKRLGISARVGGQPDHERHWRLQDGSVAVVVGQNRDVHALYPNKSHVQHSNPQISASRLSCTSESET